jgi:quercetin dioxygenase-like cupin family protein
MKSLWVAAMVSLSGIFSFAQGQVPPEVEIAADPAHHLALENGYVRVFQVEIAPHAATLLHRHHHDYMFVTLGTSEVSNEVEGKSPVTLKLADGETRFVAGNFAHIARNLGSNPFRNVTIEFLQDEKKRGSSAKWNEDRGLHILHGGTEDILFAKDGARASEVDLQTAGVDPARRSVGPQLLVAVTDLVLRSDSTSKGPSNLEMKSGDVRWFARGLNHGLTNVGRQGVKYVVVEFQ